MNIKTIATTRFNEKTYEQNVNYKKKLGQLACLYGTPIKIKETIPLESQVYVIEMNNSTNKIEGIGLIQNRLILDKNYRIYDDMDYNRYIYRGSKHLAASQITDEYDMRVINVLEQLLFKGERHCKRAQGITALSDWIVYNKYDFNFAQCFNKMFHTYLRTNERMNE